MTQAYLGDVRVWFQTTAVKGVVIFSPVEDLAFNLSEPPHL